MNQQFEILKPGTHVTVLDGPRGIIVAAMIEANWTVSYKVSWINGQTVETQWLAGFLVDAEAEPVKLGFTLPKTAPK